MEITRAHLAGLELVLTELQSSLHRTQYDQLIGLIAQASAAPEQETIGYISKKDLARLLDDVCWDGTHLTIGVDHRDQWREDTPYDNLVPIYTHVDPSEVERLRAELIKITKRARSAEAASHQDRKALKGLERVSKVVSDNIDTVYGENNVLRQKLAGAQALLREVLETPIKDQVRRKIDAFLSAQPAENQKDA